MTVAAQAQRQQKSAVPSTTIAAPGAAGTALDNGEAEKSKLTALC